MPHLHPAWARAFFSSPGLMISCIVRAHFMRPSDQTRSDLLSKQMCEEEPHCLSSASLRTRLPALTGQWPRPSVCRVPGCIHGRYF